MHGRHGTAIWLVFGVFAAGATYAGCTQDFSQFEAGPSSAGPGSGGSAATTSSRTTTTTMTTTTMMTSTTSGMGGMNAGGSNPGGGGSPPMCTDPSTDCPVAPPCVQAICNAQGNCDTMDASGSCTLGGSGGGSPGQCKAGACVQCVMDADCTATECNTASCDPTNVCVLTPVTDGANCGTNQHCITGVCGGCMGDGDCTNASNCQTNHCTTMGPNAGKCQPQDKATNDPCNSPAGNSKYCDATQNCTIECLSASVATDCPDPGTPCVTATCSGGGQCNTRNNQGTSCTGPNGAKFCDNGGACTLQCLAVGDCSGANQCQTNVCNGSGQCTTPNKAPGAGCSNGVDKFCDGNGACNQQCEAVGDCSGANQCQNNVCTPAHTCTTSNKAAGAMCVGGGASGDKFCDGNGNCGFQCEAPGDCAAQACNTVACNGSNQCAYTPVTDETGCGGGKVCIAGACVACGQDSDCQDSTHQCGACDLSTHTCKGAVKYATTPLCNDTVGACMGNAHCECDGGGTGNSHCLLASGQDCSSGGANVCAQTTCPNPSKKCGVVSNGSCSVNGDCQSLMCTATGGTTCM